MALLQGTKALETWCCLVTEGYPNVNIVNMSSSWRNGMAFCAIIHKFRPELINFELLMNFMNKTYLLLLGEEPERCLEGPTMELFPEFPPEWLVTPDS